MAAPFCARDYSDIIDPVLLAGRRKAAMHAARSRAITRLMRENADRWSALLVEENDRVERRFQRWVERKRAEARAERLGDRRAS